VRDLRIGDRLGQEILELPIRKSVQYARDMYVTYVMKICSLFAVSGVPEVPVRKKKTFSKLGGTDPSDNMAHLEKRIPI
jgi:hypothetical protein